MKKHTKHTKLTRRENGVYTSNEISFVGVKCSVISTLVQDISETLNDQLSISYLDASHSETLEKPILDTFTFHHSGTLEINKAEAINKFNERIRFSGYDLLCVNGNHYQAEKQVVILDNEKEKSIIKRIEQLDNIQFFIKLNNDSRVFSCLEEKYPECKNVPVYEIDELDKITSHIQKICVGKTPTLNGLVLAGGKSTRMGTDKGLLEYHGKAQREYLVELMQKVLSRDQKGEIYLSVREEQEEQEVLDKRTISDKFLGLGPFGAICSAFMHNPNEAFLVLATDLPFVNEELIQLLISKRNPKKIATAIKGRSKEFMEPLITIWEPKAYPILLSYLAQGYSCPRKVLINSEVEIVEVEDDLIRNINTPTEFDEVKQELKREKSK